MSGANVQTLSRSDADIQIPDGAREFVCNEEDANGSWSSVHKLDGQVILSSFYQREIPMLRQEMRNGKVHGRHVEYDETGQPMFLEHYRDGLLHGPTYQWNRDGALIHQGVFDSGTGVDIYCQDDGKLSESRPLRNGLRQGAERWWASHSEVYEETWCEKGRKHGIMRRWSDGSLEPGYPRFFIDGLEVKREVYALAAGLGRELRPYVPEEDRPERAPPPEYQPIRSD
ncbi:MAG: hypothetical protein AAFY60_02690 [Myxococcota bacterium]